jgi:hypothetical protein
VGDDTKPAMETGHRNNVGGDEDLLWPGRAMGESGTTGRRMFIGGVATPFALKKEADTASMITLEPSRPPTPGPSTLDFATQGGDGKEEAVEDGNGDEQKDENGAVSPGTTATTPFATPMVTPGLITPGGRPGLETFVTAQEVPRASS